MCKEFECSQCFSIHYLWSKKKKKMKGMGKCVTSSYIIQQYYWNEEKTRWKVNRSVKGLLILYNIAKVPKGLEVLKTLHVILVSLMTPNQTWWKAWGLGRLGLVLTNSCTLQLGFFYEHQVIYNSTSILCFHIQLNLLIGPGYIHLFEFLSLLLLM